jgi:23S rRNA pseudouridine2457 synthase
MLQYFLFHKPYQVLSQFSREGNKKTLADFFPDIAKDIYPAGRLDYDSEGLLLLTNDKSLIHRLLDPSFAHTRQYWAQVEGLITNDALQQLQNGVSISIDGKPYTTKKAKAELLNDVHGIGERNPPIRVRKNIPDSWISLTLTEGKNRQVRKMTAATGFPTLRLIRYAIGDMTVEGILPGTYKVLDADAKETLLKK